MKLSMTKYQDAINENIYKKNKINFFKNMKDKIIKELEKQGGEDFWIARVTYFIKCFFSGNEIPASISLDDIVDFVNKNENEKLESYLNYLPGIEKKFNEDLNKQIYIISDRSYEQHSYLILQLYQNKSFLMFCEIDKIIKTKKIKFYNNYILLNNKTQIFIDDDICIRNNKDSYILKDRELKIYFSNDFLMEQDVKFVEMYFYWWKKEKDWPESLNMV